MPPDNPNTIEAKELSEINKLKEALIALTDEINIEKELNINLKEQLQSVNNDLYYSFGKLSQVSGDIITFMEDKIEASPNSDFGEKLKILYSIYDSPIIKKISHNFFTQHSAVNILEQPKARQILSTGLIRNLGKDIMTNKNWKVANFPNKDTEENFGLGDFLRPEYNMVKVVDMKSGRAIWGRRTIIPANKSPTGIEKIGYETTDGRSIELINQSSNSHVDKSKYGDNVLITNKFIGFKGEGVDKQQEGNPEDFGLEKYLENPNSIMVAGDDLMVRSAQDFKALSTENKLLGNDLKLLGSGGILSSSLTKLTQSPEIEILQLTGGTQDIIEKIQTQGLLHQTDISNFSNEISSFFVGINEINKSRKSSGVKPLRVVFVGIPKFSGNTDLMNIHIDTINNNIKNTAQNFSEVKFLDTNKILNGSLADRQSIQNADLGALHAKMTRGEEKSKTESSQPKKSFAEMSEGFNEVVTSSPENLYKKPPASWFKSGVSTNEEMSRKKYIDQLKNKNNNVLSNSQPTEIPAENSNIDYSSSLISEFPDGSVQKIITDAAKQHGVDPDTLLVIGYIESKFDPKAKNPKSSAGGLFQFINSTAKGFGIANWSDRFDAKKNANAGAKLAKENMILLKNSGIKFEDWKLYLLHQQGPKGIELLKNPNKKAVDIVGKQAVVLNGGKSWMTSRQFTHEVWKTKFNQAKQKLREKYPNNYSNQNTSTNISSTEKKDNKFFDISNIPKGYDIDNVSHIEGLKIAEELGFDVIQKVKNRKGLDRVRKSTLKITNHIFRNILNYKEKITLTSVCKGKHGNNSHHYKGQALDIRVNDNNLMDIADGKGSFKGKGLKDKGWKVGSFKGYPVYKKVIDGFYVKLITEGNHIHISIDPFAKVPKSEVPEEYLNDYQTTESTDSTTVKNGNENSQNNEEIEKKRSFFKLSQDISPEHLNKFQSLWNNLTKPKMERWGNGMSGKYVVTVSRKTPAFMYISDKTGNLLAIYPTSLGKGDGSGHLNKNNTQYTPSGAFYIHTKIGAGAKENTIFRSRNNTGKTAPINGNGKEDLVLSRIMWLQGLEDHGDTNNQNRKDNTNTKDRYVYIHGTDKERDIGKNVSHGCLRMFNKEVIELFDHLSTKTFVVIED